MAIATPQVRQLPTAQTPGSEPQGAFSHQNHYESLLDRIEEQQEDLRDARDSLVGSRFRLRNKRQDLRETREKTVGRVGEVFQSMKRYFLSKDVDMPHEMKSAWFEVETLRDLLGEQEIGYEKLEESYNLEEWKYTARERSFVEGLSAGSPLPDTKASLLPHKGFPGDLTHFSFGPQDMEYLPNAIGELHAPSSPAEFIMTEETWDFKSNSKVLATPESNMILSSTPVSNFRYIIPDPRMVDFIQCPRETYRYDARVKRADVREDINAWMLEVLLSSSLQKERLKNLLPGSVRSESSCWDLVNKYWRSDDSEIAPFRTGDTTVASATASQGLTSHARKDLLDNSKFSDSETRPLSITPLAPKDQLVDALDAFEIPTKVRRGDLVEMPPRVTFATPDQSTQSDYTQFLVPASRSLLSGPEHSSVSTIDANLHFDSSVPTDMINSAKSLSWMRTNDRELSHHELKTHVPHQNHRRHSTTSLALDINIVRPARYKRKTRSASGDIKCSQ
ncbi:hypothetical protein GQ44DRAFT_769826 [Phaeosphaeriaceae sp. PMI808]|nr:hypothetical protein GQ44DRAFT_769826 [Phaeosphaeriaceae sp. PMI808]